MCRPWKRPAKSPIQPTSPRAWTPTATTFPRRASPAQGEPTITETYTETTVVVLKNGNVNMTIDQWDNWAAGPETEDEPYQLDCISANLGLTRA